MVSRCRFGNAANPLSYLRLLAAVIWLVALCDVRGDEPSGEDRVRLVHLSAAGTSVIVPNTWGTVQLSLENPTSTAVEVLATTYFDVEPTLQFGRRVWIPAKSSLQVRHPIWIPAPRSDSPQQLELRTLLLNADQPQETFIRSESGALQFDSNLRAIRDKLIIGLLTSPGSTKFADPLAPNDLLLCGQRATAPNGHITLMTDRLLPPGEEGLQSLDQLIVADDRMLEDQAGLASIRRWLFGGGKLWLMLDRVDSQLLERLLGDDSSCQVVDRVGLTTVRLDTRSSDGNVGHEVHDHELPVDLVRVLLSGTEPICTVDGWPAAFWKDCGEGRLLVTTLGPRGWMRARTAADDASASSGRFGFSGAPQPERPAPTGVLGDTPKSPFVMLETMREVCVDFFQRRAEPRLTKAILEPLVQEYVGHAIPSRWLVTTLLVSVCIVIGASGTWLWRRNRLEVMGLVSPAIAVGVSVVLIGIGWQQRQSNPAAVASFQFVRPIPGTDDVRVEGVNGFFSPGAETLTAKSQQGGWLLPDMTGMQGKTRRMIWTDFDRWHWENIPENSSLLLSAFQQSSAKPERIEARATFGPQGLSGRLQASGVVDRSDAVLATREGRIGVELLDDGSFVARHDAVFSAEQFLGTGLLSDEQHRRQRVLKQLFSDTTRRDGFHEPHLLFWSKPWNLGFQFAEGRQSLGSTLVSMPLKLERPPTGTEVWLAAPLLPYREALGPDGISPTGMWDYRRREWQEKLFPTATWLSFQIPRVLLPVTVQRGRLTLQVTGPVVRLEIAGQRRNSSEVVPIKTWTDPVGTLTLELTDADLSPISEAGGLLLRVAGGDPKLADSSQASTSEDERLSAWRIETLALELQVKTANIP